MDLGLSSPHHCVSQCLEITLRVCVCVCVCVCVYENIFIPTLTHTCACSYSAGSVSLEKPPGSAFIARTLHHTPFAF